MQIIISHINTDFDALASMLAAKKIYPDAQVIITDKQNITVGQFLAIYREKLDLIQDNQIDWSEITELIMVDEASLSRISDHIGDLNHENLKITVYDHHPKKNDNVQKDAGRIEPVGAAVTLLIEEIKQRKIAITPFEATLFGLGIYTDTGAFTYNNTTARDLEAASYLMEFGMDLDIINRFSDEMLDPDQQEILNHLFQNLTTYHIDGLNIVVGTYQADKFTKGLATLAEKLSEVTDADATLIIVEMKNRTYIIGRAHSMRVNLLPILKRWGGGGHEQAGSASVKHGDYAAIEADVKEHLNIMLKPAITARDMMTHPVKTILPETSIEEAGQLMFRYGHSGFPIVKDEKILGIITRRDLEKANHHGLGHAPVKAYMSTRVVSINPETTEEEIQKLIINRDIGRIPVVENDKLIGIVSRTNIIEMMHNKNLKEQIKQSKSEAKLGNLQEEMSAQLPRDIYNLLKNISISAKEAEVSVYLIGGIVRDIILKKPNDDIDIVVEGNGITFAKKLHADYGGEVVLHETFKTATWTSLAGVEIDITSSRLEYYDRPAALPDVESSTLKEDLYRRDFTINAMAIYLNEDDFGKLIDPFNGYQDIKEERIKILHNLSFVEDPTRVLRGVRFETRFDFLMDNQTEQLALQSIPNIKDLSANRIIGEMVRLFSEENQVRSIARLFDLNIFKQLGVDEKSKEPSLKQAEKLAELYTESKRSGKPTWFNYLFIPFYADNQIRKVKRFALTKRDLKLYEEVIDLNKLDKLNELKKIGDCYKIFKEYSTESILFFMSKAQLKTEKVILEYLIKRENIPTLLTGKDLIDKGLKPGTHFSEILSKLDEAILNDEVTTKEAAMIWLEHQQV